MSKQQAQKGCMNLNFDKAAQFAESSMAICGLFMEVGIYAAKSSVSFFTKKPTNCEGETLCIGKRISANGKELVDKGANFAKAYPQITVMAAFGAGFILDRLIRKGDK